MPCSTPLRGYRTDGGVIFKTAGDLSQTIELPCGQCVECNLERSRQWAIRCMNEAQLWPHNSAITLTYETAPRELIYRDFQLFLKRIRQRYAHKTIRFYMGGEYGERNGRPHFHALLFNHDFKDKVYYKTTQAGSKLYKSEILESLWGHGYTSTGECNFQAAAYIARYCLAPVDRSSATQEIIDPDTGEVHARRREFSKMSLRPGIGKEWLEKYMTDVYPHGAIVHDGIEQKPPRYYDTLWERRNPDAHAKLKEERTKKARDAYLDNTTARRKAKHIVKLAALNHLKRNQPWNTSSSPSTTKQPTLSEGQSSQPPRDKQSAASKTKSTE